MTDRELLSSHAKVKALQNQLGTSSKDAVQRLYMAEVDKLQQQDLNVNMFATLKNRMENSLNLFESRVAEIEKLIAKKK